MSLAVYRTLRRTYGHHEPGDGYRDFYFIAPAGLAADVAYGRRVSDLYASQVVALGDLIEMRHDTERTGA
jgi:hypothetical protein